MYLVDYHTHSQYSFDGIEPLEKMCEAAIAAGLSELAVTDHMDIFTGQPYDTRIDFDVPGGKLIHMDCDGLYRELVQIRERYKGRLTVRVGSELGQGQVNPPEADAFLKKYPLDFVIGSVHNMDGDRDVYYFDFAELDCGAFYQDYVNRLEIMAQTQDFDVMGHLTYPLRYMFARNSIRLDLKPYEAQFRSIFKCLIEKGRGIEVNASGMYQDIGETLPPLSLIKLYRECGGEIITTGSDAHQCDRIGLHMADAQMLLQEAGFKYLTVFEQRKPSFIKL